MSRNRILNQSPTSGNTRILVESGISAHLTTYIAGRRTVLITDRNIRPHLAQWVGGNHPVLVVEPGEAQKNLPCVASLYEQLLALEVDRSTLLVGCGGGVITDLTGFVASTYMRGIACGFIPTSLLAQVDAAIGGKNGVNLLGYKNTVGCFKQPEFVLCDPDLLQTLSDREFRCGLAEAIKAALIGDPELFALFTHTEFQEFRTNVDLLSTVIRRAIAVKTDIVGRDEKETGERRKLNLGHTIAHALEKQGIVSSHGEAVALGIAGIAALSRREGLLDPILEQCIVQTLQSLGFSTNSPLTPAQLSDALRADKKRENGELYLVLLAGIGDCRIQKRPLKNLAETLCFPNPETT